MTSPARNRIDLHCHTTRSDGLRAPRELFADMTSWGLGLAAITDHDTLEGYRELRDAGLGAGEGPGPRLIAAVEINSVNDGELGRRHGLGRDGAELHILGFGVDAEDEAFEAALRQQRQARALRFVRIVDRLRELGRPIDEALAMMPAGDDDALGRPRAARAMVRAGYVTSVDEAFDAWLGHARPAYVPRAGLDAQGAIAAIRAAGGVAVLAHSPAAPDLPEMIGLLRDRGLGGLEVHYRGWPAQRVAAMAAYAEAEDLVATGGSDYHGDLMSYAAAQATLHVPEEVGERLLAAIAAARAARASA
ncbi:MAG TPA: hypothetical protein VFK38_04100 [Candidatus Limnocylindrales bacterium]|nr:hypothetical protein [Candidatus Limnocylindrales bacterium]